MSALAQQNLSRAGEPRKKTGLATHRRLAADPPRRALPECEQLASPLHSAGGVQPVSASVSAREFELPTGLVEWANGRRSGSDLGHETGGHATFTYMPSKGPRPGKKEPVVRAIARRVPYDVDAFAREVRRLRDEAEPTLYPAYVRLITSSYEDPASLHVDTNRRTPGTGFPDLTVSRKILCLNWIEIKSPDVIIDPLPKLDHDRFDRYRQTLPHVVLTNGWQWRLFQGGECTARLDLPRDWLMADRALAAKERTALDAFLKRCSTLSPTAATTADEAVRLLATAANLIRLTVEGADEDGYPGPLKAARESFTDLLRTNPDDIAELNTKAFADALAQTTVFGYLLGRIEAQTDVDPSSAHAALGTIEHPFLKNSLYGLNAPDKEMESLLKGALRAACDMINRAAPKLAGPNGDWTRVTYVYEDFFAAYRPEDRFEYGVFYTPMEITRYQVREVSRVLREQFGLAGVTDPAVRFLDPACGTGTYLLALAEVAAEEAEAQQMPVGTTLFELFSDRVVGFEVSPGPACVAQARLAAWLRSPPYNVQLNKRFPVYTVNTLTPPVMGARAVTGNLWSDNIGAEQAAGDKVKANEPVLVVLGNPPWGRRDRQQFDIGAIDKAGNQQNILAGWAAGAAGAAQSVYDLYVAFWRFACQTLLERPATQQARGIVSYISNRTWLRGRPFTTVRGYMRDRGVVALITDLGGDVRMGNVSDDEGVFAIQAGCAIATLAFGGTSKTTETHFRRLLGKREDKLLQLSDPLIEWRKGPTGRTEPFAPADWGALEKARSVRDFFAGSLPGVKTHRDHLVVGLDNAEVLSRINKWNRMPAAERAEEFHASHEKGVPTPHTVSKTHLRAYRYRPLDNRVLYAARPFIQRPGSISAIYENAPEARQLQFLETSTTGGPVVIATNALPDYHAVRGSYGSHVVLIDRVNSSPQASIPGLENELDLLSDWAQIWAREMSVSVNDVGCYLLALGNAPAYVELFGEAVKSEPPKLPATIDKSIMADAIVVGRRLLDAWSLQAEAAGVWQQHSSPGTKLGTPEIRGPVVTFENGDRLVGLHPEVGDFEVSGYPVLRRYLEARTNSALSTTLATDIRKVAGE